MVNGRPRKGIDDHERLGLKVDPLQALVQGDGRRGQLGSYVQHPVRTAHTHTTRTHAHTCRREHTHAHAHTHAHTLLLSEDPAQLPHWAKSLPPRPFQLGASFGLGTLRIDDASVHLKYNFTPALVVD